MADCFSHTGRPAVTRCRQCSKPLCDECKHITEHGIFCGDKCAGDFEVFAKRAQELENQGNRKSGIPTFIKIIILLAILYAIFRVVTRFLT